MHVAALQQRKTYLKMPKGLMVVYTKSGFLKCTNTAVLNNPRFPPRWLLKYKNSHIVISTAFRKMILVPKGMFQDQEIQFYRV